MEGPAEPHPKGLENGNPSRLSATSLGATLQPSHRGLVATPALPRTSLLPTAFLIPPQP